MPLRVVSLPARMSRKQNQRMSSSVSFSDSSSDSQRMLIMSSVGPSVGYDHGSAVSTRYTAPFPFAGRLHEIVIQASPGRLADAVAAGHAAEMARQ